MITDLLGFQTFLPQTSEREREWVSEQKREREKVLWNNGAKGIKIPIQNSLKNQILFFTHRRRKLCIVISIESPSFSSLSLSLYFSVSPLSILLLSIKSKYFFCYNSQHEKMYEWDTNTIIYRQMRVKSLLFRNIEIERFDSLIRWLKDRYDSKDVIILFYPLSPSFFLFLSLYTYIFIYFVVSKEVKKLDRHLKGKSLVGNIQK